METISRLKLVQVSAAKRVICTVVHEIFSDKPTSSEAVDRLVADYEKMGVLRDMDDPETTYFNNRGEFLALLDGDGQVVGMGAIRKLDETTCELKRLWFLPEFRGRGLGRLIVEKLLTFAQGAGYSKVRLDTSRTCAMAQRLFRALQFREIERYNESGNDCFMERVL